MLVSQPEGLPGLSASWSTEEQRVSATVEGPHFSKTVQNIGTRDDWWPLFVSLFVFVFSLLCFFAIYNMLI